MSFLAPTPTPAPIYGKLMSLLSLFSVKQFRICRKITLLHRIIVFCRERDSVECSVGSLLYCYASSLHHNSGTFCWIDYHSFLKIPCVIIEPFHWLQVPVWYNFLVKKHSVFSEATITFYRMRKLFQVSHRSDFHFSLLIVVFGFHF